ncbi:MAG: hypothetical protein HWE33_01405 [Rhodobacteraceae bacterium]|nr:hypothetical protein [Paracoccaceae bacterium]
MIKLMRTAGQPVEAKGGLLFNWDVPAADAAGRPANHNLTREARRSNVILLGGHHCEPDYRPDLGARVSHLAKAA